MLQRTAAITAVVVLLGIQAAQGSRLSVPGADGPLAVSWSGSVYLATAAGAGRTIAASGEGAAWSPDGRRLVVWRRTAGPCAPCFFEIALVVPYSSQDRMIVTGSGFDPAPAWSPDGGRIAYSAIAGNTNHIFTVNVDGTDQRQLSHESDAFNPAWSPDALRIAYNAFTADGVHIFTLAASGGDRRQLDSDAYTYSVRPEWSPDGSRIAFGSDRGGTWELWTMASDGSDTRQVTSEGPPACRATPTTGCFLHRLKPSWSPTGETIAFVSERSGEGIALIAPDGTNRRTLPGMSGGTLARWQSGVSLALAPSRRTLQRGQVGTARRTTLTLRNDGPTAVDNVRVLLVPTRARIRASAPNGQCLGNTTVTCSFASVPSRSAVTITLLITPRAPGSLSVAATVTAARGDVRPADDTARMSMTARKR